MNHVTVPHDGMEAQVAEEIQLLRRLAEKDPSSLQELHQRYFHVLYATVLKVLNDTHDAEDVIQEVFSMLWQKAHLYTPSKGKPLTWVTTLARNRAIDKLRSKMRRNRLNDEFELESKTRQHQSRLDSASTVFEKERAMILKDAVDELSEEQREAISMVYFGGLTQSQAADQLGEPLGTVKARIRRGLIRLRGVVKNRLN